MPRIVSATASLQQHLMTLVATPQAYRPERCPQCGRAVGSWALSPQSRSRLGRVESDPGSSLCLSRLWQDVLSFTELFASTTLVFVEPA